MANADLYCRIGKSKIGRFMFTRYQIDFLNNLRLIIISIVVYLLCTNLSSSETTYKVYNKSDGPKEFFGLTFRSAPLRFYIPFKSDATLVEISERKLFNNQKGVREFTVDGALRFVLPVGFARTELRILNGKTSERVSLAQHLRSEETKKHLMSVYVIAFDHEEFMDQESFKKYLIAQTKKTGGIEAFIDERQRKVLKDTDNLRREINDKRTQDFPTEFRLKTTDSHSVYLMSDTYSFKRNGGYTDLVIFNGYKTYQVTINWDLKNIENEKKWALVREIQEDFMSSLQLLPEEKG